MECEDQPPDRLQSPQSQWIGDTKHTTREGKQNQPLS